MKYAATMERKGKLSLYLAFGVVFLGYLTLRLVGLVRIVLLEDHDSLSHLMDTKIFRTFDLGKIIDLDPDSSLFYPFISALFSFLGWPVETAARVTSLFFSFVLFAAILGIGIRIAGATAVVLGLVLISLNPELIGVSYAILSEPTYIGVIHLGLFLFFLQYKNPKPFGAGLLGMTFGLAFWTRLEGILFIAYIPFMSAVYYFWQKPKNYDFKRLAVWLAIFLMSFSFLVGLQIWRVSEKMDAFAINGRQVWTLLLHSDIGSSYEEKIYGLNFKPDTINISYLKENPEHLGVMAKKQKDFYEYLKTYRRTIYQNAYDLYHTKIPILIGLFPFVFFVFGLLSLYQSRKKFEIVLILSFIFMGFFAPLLHNVVIRHILIVAPIILMVAGIGVQYLGNLLQDRKMKGRIRPYILLVIFVLLMIAGWSPMLRNVFSPATYNREYSFSELKDPIAIIKRECTSPGGVPAIAARKGYLAYFVGTDKYLPLPYADYNALVTYSALNEIDFLYLKHSLIENYPFLDTFESEGYKGDFERLYRGLDAQGKPVELYRLKQTGKSISPNCGSG